MLIYVCDARQIAKYSGIEIAAPAKICQGNGLYRFTGAPRHTG